MKFIKNLALVFILISCWVNSNAQTKEETEKWNFEKINKLMAKKSVTSVLTTSSGNTRIGYEDYTPSKFFIQDGKIKMAYSYVRSRFDGEKKIQVENFDFVVSANISSIVYVSYVNRSSGDPTLKIYGDLSYLVIMLECSCATSINNSISQKENINSVPIFIDNSAESDLVNRMDKAFTQLKTFYPKPKETF